MLRARRKVENSRAGVYGDGSIRRLCRENASSTGTRSRLRTSRVGDDPTHRAMQVVLKINDLRKTNGNYTVPARSVPPRPKRESFAVGRQQAALPFVFPRVPVQRCWAHKLRSIADKVSRQEGSCVAGASALYRAISKSEVLPSAKCTDERAPCPASPTWTAVTASSTASSAT